MGEVKKLPIDFVEFHGHTIRKPRSLEEYLRICKRFLSDEVYIDIICGLHDKEYLDGIKHKYTDPEMESIRNIIKSAKEFK